MESTPRSHRRRRRGLLALLMAGTAIIGATGATFSLALFTSQATVAANSFTTGTIILTTNPVSALLTAGVPNPLMPGDTINGTLVVTNGGTGDLRYAISADSTTTGGLNTQILITIKTADIATGNTCTAWTGTTIFGGAGGVTIANVAMAPIVGDPAQGAQAGDRPLTVVTHQETLCFRAVLPLATPNGYQNTTASYTFQFDAEQTKNN
jgi:hypothetical protein